MLREEKTISEIAYEHEISPNQLRNWKKEFIENAVEVFSGDRGTRESKDKTAEMLGHDYEKRFTKRPF